MAAAGVVGNGGPGLCARHKELAISLALGALFLREPSIARCVPPSPLPPSILPLGREEHFRRSAEA